MLTAEEWVKQSIHDRKGVDLPFIIPPSQYKSLEASGVDMAQFAIQSPIPETS